MFSLPPVISCLNSASCEKSCYAIKAYRQYPAVKNLWEDNHTMAKNDLDGLYSDIVKQCEKIAKQAEHKRVIRIHQSGDFIGVDYIELWRDIARAFPSILFYGYTKVDKIFPAEIDGLNKLKNVNIISSFIDGNKRNFGTLDYIKRLETNYNSFICPASYGVNKEVVKCGIDDGRGKYDFCDYCFKNQNVVFLEH